MVHPMTQFVHGARLASWLESAWLQRYLERRLDAEETAWFEAYLLDKPALVERLERDVDLRDALALVRDTGMAALSQPTDSDGEAAPRAGVHAARARPMRAFALAATLVAGVGIGWLGHHVAPGGGSIVVANPMRVIYDTERGTSSPPRIEHADSQAPFALVEVALPPGAQAVTLHLAGAPEQRLQPSPEGFVIFLVARRSMAGDAGAELTYELDGRLARKTLSFAAMPKPTGG